MKTKPQKTCKTYLLYLTVIALAFNNALCFAHCQSEDGHSRLEPIINTCCNADTVKASPENTADSSGKTFSTNLNGCGACVDTIVFVNIIDTNKKSILLNSVIVAVSGFLTVPTPGCYNFSGHLHGSELPLSVNPSLLSIRTIILQA